MLRTVVLFFVVCAVGASILLIGKAVRARKSTPEQDRLADEQNLHTRYSVGEFSHEEYQGRLSQIRTQSTVQ